MRVLRKGTAIMTRHGPAVVASEIQLGNVDGKIKFFYEIEYPDGSKDTDGAPWVLRQEDLDSYEEVFHDTVTT